MHVLYNTTPYDRGHSELFILVSSSLPDAEEKSESDELEDSEVTRRRQAIT